MAENLHTDLLKGADQIAAYLFGDPRQRRKIYHLCGTAQLPHFKLGNTLCARKSDIEKYISDQVSRSVS